VQGAARLDASENAHGSEVAEAPAKKAKGKMPEKVVFEGRDFGRLLTDTLGKDVRLIRRNQRA
jgi:hypothetical protein